jgi:predicted metal-dependent hydrolase
MLEVGGLTVEVDRKAIKNLHLSVYPPDGRVRIAVPLRVDDDAVRLAIVSRLGWIRRQRAGFARQPRQSRREMVNGESHYLWGRRYRLNVIRHTGANGVRVRGRSALDLLVRPGADAERRNAVLRQWYREQLKAEIPALIEKWEPKVGVHVADWGVKRMKTRWGTCNIDARRIWLNLELAKKPPECLEFVLVHEMVHLLERHHDARFVGHMDRVLPPWRTRRDRLNRLPLPHENWTY